MDERIAKRLAKHVELAKNGSLRSRDIVAGIVGAFIQAEPGAVMLVAELLLKAKKPRRVSSTRGSKVHNAKLTESQVIAIKSAQKFRGIIDMLAEEYGVSRGTIKAIRLGTNWKHVAADE